MNQILQKIEKMNLDEIKKFFSTFLTKDEILEISDRVEIVKLLLNKNPQREISKQIGVSTSTVTRGASVLKSNSVKDFCKKYFNEDDSKFQINTDKPFAIISRSVNDYIEVFEGNKVEFDTINEAFLYQKTFKRKTLNLMPFCQIRERGFEVTGDEKILAIDIKKEKKVSKNELFNFAKREIKIKNNSIKYEYSDEEFCEIVKKVISSEILNGEGSNFVISRKTFGEIENFNPEIAISIFINILQNEFGFYWAYCIFTGDNFFIGATPEMHLNINKGSVRMNPISGTYRKTGDIEIDKKGLLQFLLDEKEQNELFMVTDEELKMMAQMCPNGGNVIGPMLKEMSKVVHTEYVLSGKSNFDSEKIVIESMHAATLIGGPIENACKIIKKYEKSSRRYYCGMILLIEEDGNIVDGPTIIRTLDIKQDGKFEIQSGATIVEKSDPNLELLEIKAKAAGVLSVVCGNESEKIYILKHALNDFSILEILNERNRKMSNFWSYSTQKQFFNKFDFKLKIKILDNEDSFTQMIFHILKQTGCCVEIISYKNVDENSFLNDCDMVIFGPGPGDPNSNVEKIDLNKNLINKAIDCRKKFISICLGHQILCKVLGFKVVKAENCMQGVVKNVDLFEKSNIQIGFYNTFVAKFNKNNVKNVDVCKFENDEIIALRGDNFSSFQFHPESLLTLSGYDIFFDEIKRIFCK